MNRNMLYFVIGALAVAAGVLGYRYYLDHKKSDGIQIDIGKAAYRLNKNSKHKMYLLHALLPSAHVVI